MLVDTQKLQQDTIDMIDRLKKTTVNNGLGNGGNEYVVIVETFLYKFLNDKFIHEAKKVWKPLAEAENIWNYLDNMSEEDYDEMCDLMLDTVELRKHHLLYYVATRQNEPNFSELFDSTLIDIAKKNEDVFFVTNTDNSRISILKPISNMVSGATKKRDNFCKALINDISAFSFEAAFTAGYDFFSTIFEQLIKDYNTNGGDTYAEYYTPHSIAMVMAILLVKPEENVKSVDIYDPSAGTGTLVIALAHAIGEQNCSVYTQDISDKSSSMLMLNLILNGMAHSLSHVVQGDTLLSPAHKNADGSLREFDYIVSNPPFKLDFSETQSRLKHDPYRNSKKQKRFFAGIPNVINEKKKMPIYLCFLQHLLFSLKATGKAAVVVPTGFISSKAGIGNKIIKHLVDNKILMGVVSMPSKIFATTGTNVSIVLINKAGVDKPVLIDASKLGEKKKIDNEQRTVLNEDEVNRIIDTFNGQKAAEGFSVTPTFEEIKEKGYSLSAGQYFEIKINYVDITEEEFKKRMSDYESTLTAQFEESHQLEKEILKQLHSISFNKEKASN